MLLDEIINYCDSQYKIRRNNSCGKLCNHPEQCPRTCEECLKQVHYPNEYGVLGRKDYTCNNIINFYVCKYMYKYSSEIEYAFYKQDIVEKYYNHIKAFSIGCGASPDLMAIENYLYRKNIQSKIFYHGIDMNTRWKRIHDKIKQFLKDEWEVEYEYGNVIEYFKKFYYKKYNILFMQYLISHFINLEIDPEDFFKVLIDSFIIHMDSNSTIIVNDVNSCNRGRDNIYKLLEQMKKSGIAYTIDERYFDTGIKNDFQRIGERYTKNSILDYSTDIEFNCRYNPWSLCSSFQLIIKDIKVI